MIDDPPKRKNTVRTLLPTLSTVLFGFTITSLFLLLIRAGDRQISDKNPSVSLFPWSDAAIFHLPFTHLEISSVLLAIAAMLFYLSLLNSLRVAQHDIGFKDTASPEPSGRVGFRG